MDRRGLAMVGMGVVLLALAAGTMRLPMADADQSTVLMIATVPLGLFLLVDGALVLAREARLRPHVRRDKP